MDVSAPLKPGDVISFEDDGMTKQEPIKTTFWQERPKGGKEFCYETESGIIVPISKVKGTTQKSLFVFGDETKMTFHENSDADASRTEFLKFVIEDSPLPSVSKTLMLLVMNDDIESYQIIRTMCDQKLRILQEMIPGENPNKED